MFITIANYKGGVGKTTTAVHIAAYLQRIAPTVLIDSDLNRSATAWGRHGRMPFTIVDAEEGPKQSRNFEHVVIDTEARPGMKDFAALAKGCDLLIIPTTPTALDSNALALTLAALNQLGSKSYRVLLTKIPPPPETEGAQLRAELEKEGIPLFVAEIPRLKSFEKAAADGVPVYDVQDQRAARAWAAYEAVGREIL
jgi:chromosome partitioning protein